MGHICSKSDALPEHMILRLSSVQLHDPQSAEWAGLHPGCVLAMAARLNGRSVSREEIREAFSNMDA